MTKKETENQNEESFNPLEEDMDELEKLAASGKWQDAPEEKEEIEELWRSIHKSPWSELPASIRYTGYFIAALTFTALIGMIVVLIQEVTFATSIYGPKRLQAGGHASYRISVFNPEDKSFFKKFRVKLTLKGSGQQKVLFEGSNPKGDEVLLANVDIPKWPKGKKYRLHVEAWGPRGKDAVSKPIELYTEPARRQRYGVEKEKRYWQPSVSRRSPYRIQIFSPGKTLVSSLPNWVYVRVQERKGAKPKPAAPVQPASRPASKKPLVPGSPQGTQPTGTPKPTGQGSTSRPAPKMPARVPPSPGSKAHVMPGKKAPAVPAILKKSKPNKPIPARTPAPLTSLSPFGGDSALPPVWITPKNPVIIEVSGPHKPQKIMTDKWGFAKFPFKPQFSKVAWTFDLQGTAGEARIYSHIVAEGFQLVSKLKSNIIPEGKPIELEVNSIAQDGTFHIDLIKHGERVWSTQHAFVGSKNRIKIKPPSWIKGLYSLQIYIEFYAPGRVYDNHLVYIGKPTKRTILSETRRHLRERYNAMRIVDLEDFSDFKAKKAELPQWSHHLFSYVKARFMPPKLFYDSMKDRHTALRRYQWKVRLGVTLFLICLGAMVLFGIFVWMRRSIQRDLAIQQEAVEQGLSEVGEIGTRGSFFMGLFLFLLGLFFALVIYLFYAMKWTFDGL